MRSWLSLLLFISVFGVTAYFVTPQLPRVVEVLEKPPELRFDRKQFELLEVLVPSESVLWWLSSRAQWRKITERHPEVKKAYVERCSAWSLRCFSLRIDARRPILQAELEGELWFLTEESEFYRATTRVRSDRDLPLILGLESFEDRPHFVPALLRSITQIYREFQHHEQRLLREGRSTAISLRSLEVLSPSEFFLGLRGVPFAIRVRLVEDLPDMLFENLERLLHSLDSSAYGDILEVDMGFSGMAVVRRESQSAPARSSPAS